jgi:hypothetical protein
MLQMNWSMYLDERFEKILMIYTWVLFRKIARYILWKRRVSC